MSRARSRSFASSRTLCTLLFAGLALLTVPAASAREIELTILHTADVRGHLLPLRYREHRAHSGGLLRCATRIREHRAAGGPVLLLDSGGFLAGSPESELSEGRLPLRARDALGYDAWLAASADWCVAGLDPADLGPAGGVASNLDPVDMSADRIRVFEPGGIRLVVAGLVSSHAGDCLPGATVSPAAETLIDVLGHARRVEADLVIVLLELPPGASETDAMELARQFPDIDLLLFSGPGRLLRAARVHHTLVASAGSRARWLGRVTVRFDTVRRRVVSMEGDAIPVDASVSEDRGLRGKLGSDLARIRKTLDRVLGYAGRDLGTSAPCPTRSPMMTLLYRSIGRGADAVLMPLLPGGQLAEGPIEYRDVLRAVPRVARWENLLLTPPELRTVLAANLGHIDTPQFLGVFGMEYDAHPSAGPRERIRNLRFPDGSRPHGRSRLRVRMPARVLSDPVFVSAHPGLSRLAARPESRRTVDDIDTEERVLNYIREHSPITIRTHRTHSLHLDPT